jgi:hypothetical protein
MKWLRQNVRRRVGFAIKNPHYAVKALVREFTFGEERFLVRPSGSSPRQIPTYLDAPKNTVVFATHLGNEEGHFRFLLFERPDAWRR